MIHNPKNTKKIDAYYIWLSVDPETGMEGIIGIKSGGQTMTMGTGDFRLAQILKPTIIEAMRETKMRARLVKYTRAELVEEI